MKASHCPSLAFATLLASSTLFLFSGCATSGTDADNYSSERSPVQLEASASVEAAAILTPELQALYKKHLSEKWLNNYLKALSTVLRRDLISSGLFANIQPASDQTSDYRITLTSEEGHPSDYRLQVRFQVFEGTSGRPVSDHVRDASVGNSWGDLTIGQTFERKEAALREIMAGLKADVAADLQQDIRKRQMQVSKDEAAMLTKASLPDLLASTDRSVDLARERNRAIISAKNQQLPAILHEDKTDQLSALVVKIEQMILDLNHECEVAKDQAQQAVTNNTSIEDMRGLAICYRERIELLKSMLTALKDEIANRNR